MATEQNSTHTPGPWEWLASSEYGYSALWNPETRAEIITTGGQNDGDYPITWMGEELSDADRHLIAAAPDMLATLRNIAEGNLGDEPWQANYAKIKEVAAAVIAKAEGRL